MRAYGRPFKAADALETATRIPQLAEKLKEQPSRVYSWLSRELGKNKLVREGEFYKHPAQRDGAPNGEAASAPFTGEVAASLFENPEAARLLG